MHFCYTLRFFNALISLWNYISEVSGRTINILCKGVEHDLQASHSSKFKDSDFASFHHCLVNLYAAFKICMLYTQDYLVSFLCSDTLA